MSSGGGGGQKSSLATGIGSVVGGLIGADAASGDKSKAQGYAEDAFNQLLALGLPPDLSKEIIFQKFQEAGILNPQMEQAIEQSYSKVAQMQKNTPTRDAEMEALSRFRQLSKTGLGAQDRSALNQIRDQTQRDLEGKRQQILQNAQTRGMGGSGNELIAQLQAAQGGANQSSLEGDRIAAMAQERASQALGQNASLASTIRSEDYKADLTSAEAQDQMDRMNVDRQIARQTRNVGATNLAQTQNLQNKQNLMNANTQMNNQELLRQNDAKRQNWLDQMQLAKVKSGAFGGLSDEYAGRADDTAKGEQKKWTGIGSVADSGADEFKSGVGMVTGGTGFAALSDKKAKKNIKSGDSEIKEFLEAATPYSYDYKDSNEHRVSPMAQDLEESKIGKESIMETPKGKAIDYSNIFGKIVASQGYLHKEIEDLKKKKS